MASVIYTTAFLPVGARTALSEPVFEEVPFTLFPSLDWHSIDARWQVRRPSHTLSRTAQQLRAPRKRCKTLLPPGTDWMWVRQFAISRRVAAVRTALVLALFVSLEAH